VVLFGEVESNEESQKIESIFRVIRYVISVAESELLEVLLSDQYYLFTFGVLECN